MSQMRGTNRILIYFVSLVFHATIFGGKEAPFCRALWDRPGRVENFGLTTKTRRRPLADRAGASYAPMVSISIGRDKLVRRGMPAIKPGGAVLEKPGKTVYEGERLFKGGTILGLARSLVTMFRSSASRLDYGHRPFGAYLGPATLVNRQVVINDQTTAAVTSSNSKQVQNFRCRHRGFRRGPCESRSALPIPRENWIAGGKFVSASGFSGTVYFQSIQETGKQAAAVNQDGSINQARRILRPIGSTITPLREQAKGQVSP